MISEIGSQIDLLQDRVADRLREQSAEHQQHLTEVVASQDDKLEDLEAKLYSLGNGVADLEERSNSELALVRTDGMLFGPRSASEHFSHCIPASAWFYCKAFHRIVR